MENQFEKATIGDKIAQFVTSVRGILIAVVAVLVVVVAAYGICSTLVTKSSQKALADIDSISYNLTKDSAALSDEELEARKVSALAALEPYTAKNGVAGVRADMLAAEILFSQGNNEAAAEKWVSAAKKGSKSYTAPLAYFNAGAAYENLGKLDDAAASYEKAVSYGDFDQIAHAQFSLGRVHEAKGETDEAVKVYTELFDAVPSDSWAKLAKSRLIVLTADKE